MNVSYLENMLVVFLRTFGKQRPPTPIVKPYKFIFIPFFLFLWYSPSTRSWKCFICQISLHQVPSANMLCHDSKIHFGQLEGGPELHVAQGTGHAEAQS
jgi:hypothetical protein